MEDGVGADPAKFEKAVKAADKIGERIARTTDKIMEMRHDLDAKQVRSLHLLVKGVGEDSVGGESPANRMLRLM